jgi:hypothetical protein
MKKFFNMRIFTSHVLFLTVLLLLISGAVLFSFKFPGAAGPAMEFAGMGRKVWLDRHILFGVIFIMFSLCHLFIHNRAAFFSYMKKKGAGGWNRHKELIAATTLLLSFAVMFSWNGDRNVSAIMDDESARTLPAERNVEELSDHSGEKTAFLDMGYEAHHHGEERRSGSGWSRIASRQDENAGIDGSTNGSDRGSRNSGAPDDALHRSTRASCSSCH